VCWETRGAGEPVAHCVEPGAEGVITLPIPAWMFTRAHCAQMRIADAPRGR
jgi:hypothetical protein